MSLNVYEVITQRIIDSLEAGVIPWHTPWKSVAPRNLLSKKPYRGINVFLLGASRYTSPYWMTFRQAASKGGSVRKGERGTPVIFWKRYEKDRPESFKKDSAFVLRYYTVFNLSQCEGIDAPPADSADMLPFEPIEACERIVGGYQGPEVRDGGNRAQYVPSQDVIDMPPRESFESEEAYYATRFHEMVHSTGHGTRLDRPGVTKLDYFGSHQYSYEELVAECGSAFLCGEAGILNTTIDNTAAYIAGWVKKLQSEPKWVVKAGGEAARAADYILGPSKQVDEQEGEESA